MFIPFYQHRMLISELCAMLLESDNYQMSRDENYDILACRETKIICPSPKSPSSIQPSPPFSDPYTNQSEHHPKFRSMHFICSTINISNTNTSSRESTSRSLVNPLRKLRHRPLPGIRGSSLQQPWDPKASWQPSPYCPFPFCSGHWLP